MPAVPISQIAAGSLLTPARVNHAWWIANRPAALLRQATPQTIASGGSFKPVLLDTEDEDVDPDGIGGHSTTFDTSRYTARYPGIYRVGGGVGFAVNATGSRGVAWLRNGILVDGSDVMVPAVSSASTSSRVPARSMLIRLAEGDYIELGAFQNSGGDLATTGSSAAPSVSIEWARL
jgi:hypothetical protein